MKYILLLFIFVLFLTGCQTKLLVKEADIKSLSPLLVDYALLNGYTFLHKNDTKGTYRIHLGQTYIPERINVYQESTTTFTTNNYEQALTKYEETALMSIKIKDKYVDLIVMVRLIQSQDDIEIIIEPDDTYYHHPTSTQANKLKRYLEYSGYSVKLL
jgi:hypothetical protein